MDTRKKEIFTTVATIVLAILYAILTYLRIFNIATVLIGISMLALMFYSILLSVSKR